MSSSSLLKLTFRRLVPSIIRFESSSSSSELTPTPKPKPNALNTLTKSNTDVAFDQVTHTGQAWDKSDYRLARFDIAPKQVNPNIAMHLINAIPPKECEERVVWCDGGHPALGHPRVYINLDKPGNHACGYCGLRFFNAHVHRDGSEHIQV